MKIITKTAKIFNKIYTKAEVKVKCLTDFCSSPSITDWLGNIASFAFSLARVQFCSEDFRWVSLHLADEPRVVCLL